MTYKKINTSFIISIIVFGAFFALTFYLNVDLVKELAKTSNISEIDALGKFVKNNEYYLILLFSFYAFLALIFSYVVYLSLIFLNFLFKD